MDCLIVTILITSAWCNGLHIACAPGMVLEPMMDKLDSWFAKEDEEVRWFYKPLLYCINCMASFHGTVIYLLLNGVSWNMAYELPILIVCCTWLNGVFYRIDS